MKVENGGGLAVSVVVVITTGDCATGAEAAATNRGASLCVSSSYPHYDNTCLGNRDTKCWCQHGLGEHDCHS